MSTWVQMEATRKETKYPEISGGNMLLKKEEETNEPIECQRVMMQRIHECPKMKINSPEDVVKLLKELKDYDRERAIILSLDTKNNVVSIENISTGSLNASIVHPREAIKGSLLVNAANIIFAHNHPSGDPAPSVEDRAINKKLQEAFNIVGIDMLDSIIIGRDGYYSAREHGEMFPESKFKESKPGEMKTMERTQIESDEDDACSTAMTAAMEVITERCSDGVAETNEPKEGKFLRLHIQQEIKLIHALALDNNSSVKFRAENTIKQIDINVDNGMISSEYADTLKADVQKAARLN